jgi:hypothetical protein
MKLISQIKLLTYKHCSIFGQKFKIIQAPYENPATITNADETHYKYYKCRQ